MVCSRVDAGQILADGKISRINRACYPVRILLRHKKFGRVTPHIGRHRRAS
jgi:hypothetical protein